MGKPKPREGTGSAQGHTAGEPVSHWGRWGWVLTCLSHLPASLTQAQGLMGHQVAGVPRCTHLPGSVLVTQSPRLLFPAQTGPHPFSILATAELTFITFSTFFPRTRCSLSAELCPQLRVTSHLHTFPEGPTASALRRHSRPGFQWWPCEGRTSSRGLAPLGGAILVYKVRTNKIRTVSGEIA